MKRTLSILFTVLTMLVVVHPVMAFHYCSGNLAAVKLFKSQEMHACCCADTEASQHDELEKSVQAQCCHTTVVEFSAGDFEYTGIERVSQPDQSTSCYFATLTTSEISDDCFANYTIAYAPPEHFFITGREILTRICTFII